MIDSFATFLRVSLQNQSVVRSSTPIMICQRRDGQGPTSAAELLIFHSATPFLSQLALMLNFSVF